MEKSLGKANSGVEAYRAGFFVISGLWAVDRLPESDERGGLQVPLILALRVRPAYSWFPVKLR